MMSEARRLIQVREASLQETVTELDPERTEDLHVSELSSEDAGLTSVTAVTPRRAASAIESPRSAASKTAKSTSAPIAVTNVKPLEQQLVTGHEQG